MKMKNKSPREKSKKQISKRLIAAAPYLLGACESILVTLEDMELNDIGALQDVRDAIQRAT